MDAPVDLEELKPGAWGFFFVPPFSKALSYLQVSSLAPYSSDLLYVSLFIRPLTSNGPIRPVS